MNKLILKRSSRTRRRARIRSVVSGSSTRPRLSVFRSAQHIYAQLIDDASGKTLLTSSSLKIKDKKMKKSEVAKVVGIEFGKLAIKSGIKKVSFDRGGYAYHGRVKALADGARESGLDF